MLEQWTFRIKIYSTAKVFVEKHDKIRKIYCMNDGETEIKLFRRGINKPKNL